jgi:hypothetical protein
VFDAPVRLIGRLVDIDVTAAGAWSMSGIVADGLADAVPLEHLFAAGDGKGPAAADVYQIRLPASNTPEV